MRGFMGAVEREIVAKSKEDSRAQKEGE